MTTEQLWLEERPRLEARLRLRMTRADAQEVLDETFARLGGNSSPGQLWQTAWYVEQELRRATRRREYIEEQAGILTGRAIPNIETAILRADFDRAFRALPRPEAEAFALVELRGLTQLEAAEVLGVSQPTVHRRCEAARTYLRKELS